MDVEAFIEKWRKSGGNERANTQLFVSELCQLLGVEAPEPTQADVSLNDYVFERHVIKTEIDGATSNGWIDCYKRDSFILEAKQGSAADAAAVDSGHGDSLRDFFGQTAEQRFKRGMAKRGTGQWTGAMQRAAGQAEGYAKALPREHGWPPFLLVSDIGHCIDVYADFSRSGKGYAPYPDRRGFRITLDDLRDETVRERLRAIWAAPMSLDPAIKAAEVTRDIAGHLATLARRLEKREHNPDRVAAFLMRLLFTMFAEDTGLIPRKSFSAMLKRVRDRPENLSFQLTQLWQAMNDGGPAYGLGETGEIVREFNGYLFKDTTAIPLEAEEIDVLIKAAESDWRQVEPAIFGTLLERALNPKERAKLGAHYTPRAYVERLVGPTIMEPLKEDWLGARTAATEAAEKGDKDAARKIVEGFHGKLARTKVLDPACGTGNFLYVSMARMKELEGEVLELLEELGDDQYLAEISGHTITPENFLGIEINPRAAAIAQLVLWIGYLQWHFKVNGEDRMPEPPVLRDVKTIENRDALIEWDDRVLERDKAGVPVTRWDGETMKKHPVTGKDVPDESARVEVYRYVNPKAAKWPKADFIVGNPPFIGNKRIRDQLSDSYFEALRRAHKAVRGDADFVFYWWRIGALLVSQDRARRMGFITTNTLSQASGSAIIGEALNRLSPVSVAFAVKDHPWRDEQTDAAVRVSMTVVTRGKKQGRLLHVDPATAEAVSEAIGQITADISVGSDVRATLSLKANQDMSWMGVKLAGEGFRLSSAERESLLHAGVPSTLMPRLLAGSDITGGSLERHVIDAFGLTEQQIRDNYPAAFQRLYEHVRPGRLQLKRQSYVDNWWIFAEPRPRMRKALAGLSRYIATSEVAKHRLFVFEQAQTTLPDGSVIIISSSDAWVLGVLTSRAHVTWTVRSSGTLEDRPRYQNSVAFDPFPFPDSSDEALKSRIRDAAERLDALRKDVLERHEDLTLTRLYNALEALRAAEAAGTVLSEKDRDIATRGCVSLIRHYHDEIDAAVAEAYGWDDWAAPNPPPALLGEGDHAKHGGGAADAVGGLTPATPPPPSAVPLPEQARGGSVGDAFDARPAPPPPGSAGRSPSPSGARATAGFAGGPSTASRSPSPSEARGGLSDEEILERLVALNKERAAEEAKGKVRWLRPEFQAPGYKAPAETARLDLGEEVPAKPTAEIVEWPGQLPDQVVAVAGVVERSGRPMAANDVARAFKGKRAATVMPVLDALAGMGRLRKLEDGRYAA